MNGLKTITRMNGLLLFSIGMQVEQDDQEFTTQVDQAKVSHEGLEFQTWEEARDFYSTYAKKAGFSTHTQNCKKNKQTNAFVRKMFTCSKEGKQMNSAKINANMLRFEQGKGKGERRDVVVVKEVWVVKYFIEQHNHPLVTPRKVHLLRSHRGASTTKRALMQDCKHFEFEGFLFRHMLCWMRVEQVMLVPKKYIKERWTKNARNNLIYATSHNLVAGQSILGRRGTLMKLARELIEEASLTEARSKLLMEKVKVLKIEIGGIVVEECTIKPSSIIESGDEVVRVSDPEPETKNLCCRVPEHVVSVIELAMIGANAPTCRSWIIYFDRPL
ncbi:FAR1-related sequence 2, partial [Striga asiatica]